MKRKFFSILTALALCLSLCPFTASAADPDGTELNPWPCGEVKAWLSDSNETLHIEGTGKMEDYTFPDVPPWNSHTGDICKVVIGSGVTSIGVSAFARCSKVTDVTIPEDVTKIEFGAFQGTGLTSVTIPSNVEKVDASVFSQCVQLAEVTFLGRETTVVGSERETAFDNCNNLTAVNVPHGTEDHYSNQTGIPKNVTITADPYHVLGENGDCTCGKKVLASVKKDENVTYYTDLEEAFNAVSDAGTVKLLTDVTLPVGKFLTVKKNTSLTLDCGEFTLSGRSGYVINVSGTLNFEGGTLRNTMGMGGGEVVEVWQGGTFTMSGGTLETEGAAVAAVVAQGEDNSNATVTISGGSVRAGGKGLAIGAYTTIRLSGGTYGTISAGMTGDDVTDPDITVPGLLGHTGDTRYAFFKDGKPVALEENQHSLEGPVTVKPCTHEGATVTVNNDGTHNINCPYCGYEVENEPHTPQEDGTCTCGAKIVASVAKDGATVYVTADGLAGVFAQDSSYDDATVTLLDNVTTNACIDVYAGGLTLDLNGKTYTCDGDTAFHVKLDDSDDSSNPKTMTITGGGEVTASSDYCIVMESGIWGSLNIDSGSFSANKCAVYEKKGDLKLTGGSFTGGENAILYDNGTEILYALKNDGGADAPRYAFYQDSKPCLFDEGSSLPAGTFTVKTCGHDGPQVRARPIEGLKTHSIICPYCRYGDQLYTDTHDTVLKAEADQAASTVTLSEGCETCSYSRTLGTMKVDFPEAVYGERQKEIKITDIPANSLVLYKVDDGRESQTQDNDTEVSVELNQLFGNKAMTVGKHILKVRFTYFFNTTTNVWGDSNDCELSFNIAPIPLTADMVALDNTEVTYNGTEQKPTVAVKQGDTPLTEGTDYEVAYKRGDADTEDFINAGTVNVIVTGTGNYGGTVTKEFTIGKATPSVTEAPTAALSYGQKLSDSTLTGGGAVNPNGNATVAGRWEWAAPDTQPTASGEYDITFKPADPDNYDPPASVKAAVTVNPAEPKITLTVPAYQTAGREVTVTYQVENPYDAAFTEGIPETVTLTYQIGSEAARPITGGSFTIPEGTAKDTVITVTAVTAAVDGKYTAATGTATVTVTEKISVTITGVNAANAAYNGGTHSGYTGTPTALPYSGDFTTTYAAADGTALSGPPTNAGDYTVTIDLTEAAKETYAAAPLELNFSITKASATVTADSKTVTKGAPVPAYTCTVSPAGVNLGFTPALSCDYAADSGAGEYPITVTGAEVSADGNYTIAYVNGTLTVKEPSSSGGGGTAVNVTGVSLDRNSLTLTTGESFSLTATITPSNADNKSVTWTSGNPAVASVSGGTVTAVGPGTTTITVTTQSGGYTASCTVTVKAKAYTITYDANGGTGIMGTGTAAEGEAFTLPGCTFTPPEGKVFDAWAIGSADGTQVKAGSGHTFTVDTTVYAVWKDAPLVTYAVTYNANGGAGTMNSGIAPDQEAFVLPECGFTAPEGKEFDCWAIGGATGPKVQPGGSYTFTANTTVYALWKDLPPVPYDITGIVRQNGEVVPGATVQLKRGADVIAAQTTGADGSFTFSDVPAGVYNLVAIKDGITVTVMQEITSGSVNLTITLPNGKTNTVVEIKGQEETPPVVVGEMENLFTDDTVYTAEDKEIVATGGTVEFKMVVEKQDASSSAAIQIEARKPAGQTIGLFLDLSIIKTVTPKDGQAETTSVTQVGSLIETLILLPDEMQGKDSYTVYREHDGVVEVLPNSGSGERYTVSSDKKSITIYARKYSTYAIAWSDNGGSTPIEPGKPSRPSGGGGGSSVSTYAVTVSKTTYGKVVTSRTNASSGSTVTLTVTPDNGYTLDTLAVTDSRGNAVKLTDKGSGKYTFTMPSRAVTVTASFVPTVWNNPYTDVATGAWYYEAVRFVNENGLMEGYGKGLFGPNDNLSRAQLVQILYNHAGRPAVQNGSTFTDAAPGAWYADAVAWAAAEGIISGYGGGRLGPNDPITREQLAVILWRYAGFPVPPNILLDFPDANTASGYALDALRWAVEQGIISGYSNGRLEPKTPATRGQVAQILQNFLQKQ